MDRIGKIRQLLEDSPEDLFLKHALALEYIKIERDKEARLLFEEILNTNPDFVGSYYHLGKLYERCNLIEKAEAVYQNGIAAAIKCGDTHAANELRAALDDAE